MYNYNKYIIPYICFIYYNYFNIYKLILKSIAWNEIIYEQIIIYFEI